MNKDSLCYNMVVQREIQQIFSHLDFISRLLGLLIYDDKDHKSTISKICRYAWWIFVTLIHLTFLYTGLSEFCLDYFTHNWLMISVRQTKFVIDSIMIIFTIGKTPFVKKNLYFIMDTIVSVDEELKILSLPTDYKKSHRWWKSSCSVINSDNWLIMKINVDFRMAVLLLYGNISLTVFYLVAFKLLVSHCNVSNPRFDFWEISIIVQITLQVQFLTIMMIIYCRFKALNTYLEEFHTGKVNSNDIFWVTPVG